MAVGTFSETNKTFWISFWVICIVEKLVHLAFEGFYKILKVFFVDIYIFKKLFSIKSFDNELKNKLSFKVIFNVIPFFLLNMLYAIEDTDEEKAQKFFGI